MQYFIFFRNLDKKGSLDLRSKFLLMLRIIFDCISRMAFLSAYMYSIKGHLFRYTLKLWLKTKQFYILRPDVVLICYYGVFLILITFNVIFNEKKMEISLQYWTGKIYEFSFFKFIYHEYFRPFSKQSFICFNF